MSKLSFFLAAFSIIFSSSVFSKDDADRAERLTKYYEELRGDWGKIFPNGNRNAGGAQFFKYILSNSSTSEEFFEKNKMYCAVSGSLVRPGSSPDFISIAHKDSEGLKCGFLYRCCWPCSCDVMKYVTVEQFEVKFSDAKKFIDVLTIKNPCEKNNFPVEVDRDLFCTGSSLNKKRVADINGRLIVGMFFEGQVCSSDDFKRINQEAITGGLCPLRNNTPTNEVEGGMGDIFIKLAN